MVKKKACGNDSVQKAKLKVKPFIVKASKNKTAMGGLF